MSKKLSKSEELLIKSREKRNARRKIQQESNQPSINENLKRNNSNRVAIKLSYDQLYEAPQLWNKYSKHAEEKKTQMLESLAENGLIEPISVWKISKDKVEQYYENHKNRYVFEGNEYMILVGHNRAEECQDIFKLTKDNEFDGISAFVYDEDTLNEFTARSLIVDTNYLARDLSLEEKIESVDFKYEIYQDPKNKNKIKGTTTAKIIAKEFDTSERTVSNYRTFSKLNEGIKQLVFDKKINFYKALNLKFLSLESQEWLYDNFSDKITDAKLGKIKKGMTKENIQSIFKTVEEKAPTHIKVSYSIPVKLEKDFRKMAEQWLETNN